MLLYRLWWRYTGGVWGGSEDQEDQGQISDDMEDKSSEDHNDPKQISDNKSETVVIKKRDQGCL